MRIRPVPAILILALGWSGCAAPESRTVELTPLNDSGVEGSATLTDLGGGRTRVEITVDPAGNPDMPAHIHSGTCGDLVPQPEYALVNVVGGLSTTEIAAPLGDLFSSMAAINLHQSNAALEISTACAQLTGGG